MPVEEAESAEEATVLILGIGLEDWPPDCHSLWEHFLPGLWAAVWVTWDLACLPQGQLWAERAAQQRLLPASGEVLPELPAPELWLHSE
jgi:hypothetical protein